MPMFLPNYQTWWARVEPRIPKWALKPTVGQAMAVAIMFLPVLLAVNIVPAVTDSTTIKLAVYIPAGLGGWLAGAGFWFRVTKPKKKKGKA